MGALSGTWGEEGRLADYPISSHLGYRGCAHLKGETMNFLWLILAFPLVLLTYVVLLFCIANMNIACDPTSNGWMVRRHIRFFWYGVAGGTVLIGLIVICVLRFLP
jgi:hypothetical protein